MPTGLTGVNVAALCALCALRVALAPAASAQRYRVVVGEEGSTRVSLVEFRPCVPAETSDCGAWLVRTFDGPADSTLRPGVGAQQIDSRRGSRIAIEGSAVVVTPLSSGRQPVRVTGTHGRPIALALAPDGAYAFGIFAGVAGQSSELAMIDLNTCTVWAIFPLARRPAGIAMAPP
jgi:hypothetical protein